MMPADGLEQIAKHDAIYLGAVGWPGVPDHVSLWGLLIPIRRGFQQYVNLRPVRLFEGLKSPLADRKPGDIDYFIVRENNEGEYSSIGGRMYEGTELEQAIQQAVFTRKGCDRVMRYAFNLAMTRKRSEVASATKSNGISISMPYWDERFAAIAQGVPAGQDQPVPHRHPGRASGAQPDWFDVIVGSNLFGDILSDLGPATTGTIAIAPGGNINPERAFPSMFEPVHGSAPDIAGKGIANPIGQIWSGAMMLEHLGPQGGRRRHRQGDRAAVYRDRRAHRATWAARRAAGSWAMPSSPWWRPASAEFFGHFRQRPIPAITARASGASHPRAEGASMPLRPAKGLCITVVLAACAGPPAAAQVESVTTLKLREAAAVLQRGNVDQALALYDRGRCRTSRCPTTVAPPSSTIAALPTRGASSPRRPSRTSIARSSSIQSMPPSTTIAATCCWGLAP